MYGQLNFVNRGKPNEGSNCWMTVEGSDLPSPLRPFHIKVLIAKAVVSLPLLFSGIDGKLFFCLFGYFEGGQTP